MPGEPFKFAAAFLALYRMEWGISVVDWSKHSVCSDWMRFRRALLMALFSISYSDALTFLPEEILHATQHYLPKKF